jgi:hypothetical protein
MAHLTGRFCGYPRAEGYFLVCSNDRSRESGEIAYSSSPVLDSNRAKVIQREVIPFLENPANSA